MKYLKYIAWTLIILTILLILSYLYLSNIQTHAHEINSEKITSLGYKITDKGDYEILRKSNIVKEKAIVLFTGGLVNPYYYIEGHIADLSEHYDADIVIIKSFLNLTFFSTDTLKQIIGIEKYNNYILIGHSLGGVSICRSYQNLDSAQKSKINSVILYATYCEKESMLEAVPTFSIVGGLDKIDKDKFHSKNSSANEYLVIEGADHYSYGLFEKDSQKVEGKFPNADILNKIKTYLFENLNFK